MYLFFSRFSKLSARRGNSCFLSLLSVPRYSMAETLPESPGIRFESIKASALRDLTGTAHRGNSRFFSSGRDSSESPLHRFRSHLPLSVTNLTNAYWCEVQLQFQLRGGKKKDTKAMKLGRARHENSDKNVINPFDTQIRPYSSESFKKRPDFSSNEDWLAFAMCESIHAIQNTLWEKPEFVREFFLIGLLDDQFVYGFVDKIENGPRLVELKFRSSKYTIGHDQHMRNMFQIYLYQWIWDTNLKDDFHVDLFFKRYPFKPQHLVSCQDVPRTLQLGVQTFSDVCHLYNAILKKLPSTYEAVLRYNEKKKDLDEDEEEYFTKPTEESFVMVTFRKMMEFWRGHRRAEQTKHIWRCKICDYRDYCSGSARVAVAHAPDDHHDLDFWNVKQALSAQFLAFAAAEAKQPKWWEKKAGPGIPCEVRFIREDYCSGSARVPVAHAPDDHHDLDFWNVKQALSVQFLAFAAAEAKQPKWWEKKAGPGIPCEVHSRREDNGSSENVQSATISQIICGIKLDNGSVCEKVPVEGRKRCEEHKGMRIRS